MRKVFLSLVSILIGLLLTALIVYFCVVLSIHIHNGDTEPELLFIEQTGIIIGGLIGLFFCSCAEISAFSYIFNI